MGGRNHQRKSGFSLIELLIIVIIMGILLTIAIPAYHNGLERSRGRNAEFNLISIYNAQKRHRLTQDAYFGCAGAGTCTNEELRNNLGVHVSDPYFRYSIIADGITFTATATRIGRSPCPPNAVMTVTEGSSIVNRGCEIW